MHAQHIANSRNGAYKLVIRTSLDEGTVCLHILLKRPTTNALTNPRSPVGSGAWRIIDGKLYLFYNLGYAEYFEENAKDLVAKADENWPTVEARLIAQ